MKLRYKTRTQHPHSHQNNEQQKKQSKKKKTQHNNNKKQQRRNKQCERQQTMNQQQWNRRLEWTAAEATQWLKYIYLANFPLGSCVVK